MKIFTTLLLFLVAISGILAVPTSEQIQKIVAGLTSWLRSKSNLKHATKIAEESKPLLISLLRAQTTSAALVVMSTDKMWEKLRAKGKKLNTDNILEEAIFDVGDISDYSSFNSLKSFMDSNGNQVDSFAGYSYTIMEDSVSAKSFVACQDACDGSGKKQCAKVRFAKGFPDYKLILATSSSFNLVPCRRIS